jgi:hypothetical protein
MPHEIRALDLICYIGSVCPLAAVTALASVKPADQLFRLSVLLNEEDGLELHWSVAPVTFFIATRFLRHSTESVGPGKDLPELGEVPVTYQGVGKIPSAIPRSQSRLILIRLRHR